MKAIRLSFFQMLSYMRRDMMLFAGYPAARSGVPAISAFLVAAVLLPVFKLTPLSIVDIALLAAGGHCRVLSSHC